MKDSRVAVIGTGLMRGGIARTCVQAGYEVISIDLYAPALDKARSNIGKLFDRKIAKGTITEGERAEIMDRLAYSCDSGDVKGTGTVIEAVSEKVEVKRSVFKKVDELTDPDTIIVPSISALSISEITSAIGRAGKMTGVYFFYSAPVMKLAELIRGIVTSDDIYGKVRAFVIDIRKEVTDCPELLGFIVNRTLVPMINGAIFLIMEGCKPEGANRTMKLGADHPIGPSGLCDFVGVDIMLATITGLYNGFRDNKYRPCSILENMVEVGHLGRRIGQGSYQCI